MTPERWQKVESVLDHLLEREPSKWTALLDDACSEDDQLRREVNTLLQHYTRAGKDLKAPTRPLAGLLDSRFAEHDRDIAGQRIGPYRVVHPLGRGGMGAVYLAERADGQYEQQVALKVLRLDGARKNEMQRFRAERQIMAGLQHPNIARLLDGGMTEDGQPYLVMEHVEGQSIDRYCDTHHLTIKERLQLFRPVCEAVQQAHQQRVIHRDLKPGNILVTDQGVVKLLDFGISKILDEESAPPVTLPVTRTGVHLMTPEYAAPEQVSGKEIAAATDVYQLGAVLYELLTGHRPFEFESYRPSVIEHTVLEEPLEKPSSAVSRSPEQNDDDTEATTMVGLQQISQARDVTISSLKATLRGDLDTILMKALRKEPARRYASAEDFADDINRYVEGQPVQAQKARWSYRARKYIGQYHWSVGAAAFALFLLMAYAAIITVQTRRVAHERDQAQAKVMRAERTTSFLTKLLATTTLPPEHDTGQAEKNLLDAGADRLRNNLTDQPAVRIRLMNLLGSAYHRQGFYKEALELRQQALGLARNRDGAQSRRIAALQNNIGEELYALGRYEQAKQHYQRALTLRRAVRGQKHLEVAQSVHNLILTDLALGHLTHAEQLAQQALATFEDRPDKRYKLVSKAQNVLNVILRSRGKPHKETPVQRNPLDKYQQLPRKDRLKVARAVAHNDLGLTLDRQGRTAAAEKEHRRALVVFQRLLPANHPFTNQAWAGLARALSGQERYGDAERFYRKALNHQAQDSPKTNPRRASLLIEMGRLLLKNGRNAEADSLLREALRLREQEFPAGHPLIAEAKQVLTSSH